MAAAAVLSFVLASCATDAVTGKKVFNYYSMDQEVKMGQSTLKSNTEALEKKGVQVNQNSEKLAQIERIMRDIAAVSDLPDLPYNVTLYHTNIVNAAAAPGGSMFVFEGLYNSDEALVHDEDELAAVMSHEIAHVTSRHVTERLSTLIPLGVLTEIGAMILDANNEDGWADFLRIGVGAGTLIYIPSYTRKNEYEADRIGIRYMAKAGYDPRAAPRIWKRVTEKTGKKDKASIFATHPSNWDRYRELERLLPQALEDYRKATGKYPDGYVPGKV
jgi:predicted Zn-dependent protease